MLSCFCRAELWGHLQQDPPQGVEPRGDHHRLPVLLLAGGHQALALFAAVVGVPASPAGRAHGGVLAGLPGHQGVGQVAPRRAGGEQFILFLYSYNLGFRVLLLAGGYQDPALFAAVVGVPAFPAGRARRVALAGLPGHPRHFTQFP